ncbi:hypothetical protein N7532_010120 [Penicillium argentinense]|uniref:Chromosome segregation ATPase family protein n=1 Tax=Penicillium argentinense TaxID=1131581 RepID=A0A9W9JXC2_9EURO|nr:uncharacterized protein N7532_010120 [Penicillium argentinense]KAJ5085349.1 hypothetical protein N7532_010120 [Penicillium argentinense]
MPSQERDTSSRDRELVRHSGSHAESGRLAVPMWDSSDPERAPPPLPLNPRSMSPNTKSNVSPNIQAVAAKFTDKPSENAPSSYTTNPMPSKPSSPERQLVKGHYHKRMQSLPAGEKKGDARSEFLNYLENRSPERPLRATIVGPTQKQQDPTKSAGSPPNRPAEREFPSYISNRYLSKPILGENTPPSATMLALQNMQLPAENDPPSPSKPPKMLTASAHTPEAEPTPSCGPTMGSIETQIQSLTEIASNLQREMSNLSRRSKDNATDLVSLKAATNARDEDIRKSLKELSSSLTSKLLDNDGLRSDLKAFLKPREGINQSELDSSPNSKRSYSVPRMPSPNPFGGYDRDFCGSPAPISDGSASIALLEKVLREMATKEGEERLLELVDEIKTRPAATASDRDADQKITNMLEEILNIVKEDPSSRALVRSMQALNNVPAGNPNAEGSRSLFAGSINQTATVQALNLSKGDNADQPLSADEDMMAILKSVKNSVIEGGGMTNGVKSLVRELRGEVLGMGRDLARKLEGIESTRAIEGQEKPDPPTAEEISSIVNESLKTLEEQLAATIEESRQHSSALSDFQSTMSLASIYSVVKRALDELELPQPQDEPRGNGMEKEDILETVREAWETYKPEIELQNFGLERDEILDCLSEGLKDYQPRHQESVTYDQVLQAVQTGMQNFTPPPVEQPPTITRDEIILTIRECLEKPEPTSRGLDEDHANQLNSMKEEILSAIASHAAEKPTSRGFDEDQYNYFNSIKDEILHAFAMHAAEKPAARSLDEEHINHFNSIKDEILHAVAMHAAESSAPRGLDEDHVNHSNSVKEEILGAIAMHAADKPASEGLNEDHLNHLNNIRDEILNAFANHTAEKSTSRGVNEEHMEHLDNLRDEILNALTGSMATQSMISKESFDSGLGRDEIVSAVSDGLEAHFTAAKDLEEPRISRGDVINAVNDAFDAQQSALSSAVQQPSISREEIMSAIADGIELSRKDHDTTVANISPSLSREEILEAIAEGLHNSSEADKSALSTNVSPGITREDVFNAVLEGMENSNTMTREIELNKDDLMEAITAGLHEVNTSANLNAGDQVMDRLQDVVDGMKEEFKQYSAANGKDTEQVLDAIKDGLDVVRNEIGTYVAAAQDDAGKHEIIDTVKEGFRLLQADMEKTITDTSLSNAPRGNPDTPELLDAMEKEFEHLRSTIVNMVVRDTTAGDKDEILDAIREVSEQQKSKGGDDQVVNSIREEFENLRERMDSSLVHAESTSDKEEIIAAVREHLDVIREEALNKKDGGESTMSATSELLDAFNDGIDTIKDDLKKLLEKPAELDTSEVLDTIKDGLADLKVDIDSLRQSQKEQKEADHASTTRGGELMLADSPNQGTDIEGLKTLITELQGKVESIDSTPRAPEPAEDALKKCHIDEVLVALQEVQVVIADMSASREAQEGQVKKEDIEGIEHLIMDTKTQLDEISFPAPDQIATSEHIGTLETMIRESKDALAELSTRMESEAPTKSDMGTLEGLIKDVWIALDELKGKTKEDEEKDESENADSDKLLKSDLQTVEAMVFEVKSQIDELKIPDPETLPTKEELQGLQSLVTDFREKVEANNDLTAQGFDARKTEHAGLAEKIDEAKYVVGELGDELKSKLDGSSEGLTELKQLLEGLAISAENFSTVESIKELTDLINREFERAHGVEEAIKLDKEERDAAAMVKHDETRAAIIVELGSKLDEKIGEVMAKYDEAHNSLHFKFSETEERDLAHAEAVTSTKSLAEDIRLVIGAMGDNVTQTCERIGEDTKALFGKVDESYTRMEEMHNEVKSHQEQSRTENERAVTATERVESKLLEFHPLILETVQEILTVVSQHYDHSQKSAEDFRTELSALPNTIPTMLPALPPPESTRDLENDPVHGKLNDILEHAKNSKVHDVLNTLLEHSQNNQLHEKLDRALDQSAGPKDEIYEKLDRLLDHAANDNGSLHEKLDALLSRPASNTDEQSVTQMMKLDEMRKDIMENTRKMNEMFAAQSALVAEDTERKRREAEDAAIALERRVAQREQVEAEIVGLHEEKDSLLKMIQTLQTEKEDLAKQNTKLSKEVSGLETALEIRHEEIQQIEERAETLEKRILEGVLDHARSVLLSRSTGTQAMNLKRNRSARSSRTGARSPSMTSVASTAKESKDARSLLGNGVGMALKRGMSNKLNAGTAPVQPNIGKERRILSLSHVTGNRGMDRQASGNNGLTNLKRSHSVKSNFSLRKSSWAGRISVADKENEPFREEDEHGSEHESDAGTERRTSYVGTERKSSYAGTVTDSIVTGVTESVASTDRRTSGMSTEDGHTEDGHTEVAASSIACGDLDEVDEEHDQSDRASESGADSDDAQTALGDDDEESNIDHKEAEDVDDDEMQDAVDKHVSVTASEMEAQVLKMLEPPTDSGLGTETTVST